MRLNIMLLLCQGYHGFLAQCQSCCPRCNHIKGEYPLHGTLDHLRRILANETACH